MSEQYTKVGKYILLEKLAIGGMAEVFLAKTLDDDNFNKFVAIKRILPHFLNNTEFLNLFKKEIALSLNLNHGNIVTHYDFIKENDQYYLVMEFVNGVNLKQIDHDLKFTKSEFHPAHVLYIVSQIAAGLDYAHHCNEIVTNRKLNIIHRDLSPHNIMITFNGLVKIIDFGIAKANSKADATKVGTLKGKFSYMSPEQSQSAPLDCRSDLFSLGIIFWELLVGQKLFEGNNDYETLKKINSDPIPAPSHFNNKISADIDKIVLKLLQKNLDDRYQTAADFKYDVDQVLNQKFSSFRTSHFVQFVDGLYADIIKAKSEKLIEYSKIKQTQPIDTFNIVNSLSKSKQSVSAVVSQVELPEGFKSKVVDRPVEPINFDKLTKKYPFTSDPNIRPKQRAAHFFATEKLKTLEVEETQSSSIFSFINNFQHLIMMVVFLYAGFSFYEEYFKENNTESASIAPTPPLAADAPVSVQEAQKISEDKTYSIYKNPQKDDSFSKEVINKLKKSNQLAYANINLTNNQFEDTQIFVDGKLIFEKSPVRLFPIYSNRLIKIVAYNKKYNLYDEKSIVVKPRQSANIVLSLKPYNQNK